MRKYWRNRFKEKKHIREQKTMKMTLESDKVLCNGEDEECSGCLKEDDNHIFEENPERRTFDSENEVSYNSEDVDCKESCTLKDSAQSSTDSGSNSIHKIYMQLLQNGYFDRTNPGRDGVHIDTTFMSCRNDGEELIENTDRTNVNNTYLSTIGESIEEPIVTSTKNDQRSELTSAPHQEVHSLVMKPDHEMDEINHTKNASYCNKKQLSKENYISNSRVEMKNSHDKVTFSKSFPQSELKREYEYDNLTTTRIGNYSNPREFSDDESTKTIETISNILQQIFIANLKAIRDKNLLTNGTAMISDAKFTESLKKILNGSDVLDKFCMEGGALPECVTQRSNKDKYTHVMTMSYQSESTDSYDEAEVFKMNEISEEEALDKLKDPLMEISERILLPSEIPGQEPMVEIYFLSGCDRNVIIIRKNTCEQVWSNWLIDMSCSATLEAISTTRKNKDDKIVKFQIATSSSKVSLTLHY